MLELLLALTPGLVVLGSLFVLMPQMRQFTYETPLRIETRQRLWWAAERLSAAISATQRPAPMEDGLVRLSRVIPVVRPLGEGGGTGGLDLIAPTGPGLARLRTSSSETGGGLALDASPCPVLGTVCGFSRDDVAVVTDSLGHFDIIEVASAMKAGATLRLREPLQADYPAGAWVVAVRADRWTVDPEPDGGLRLRRRSRAGAIDTVAEGLSRASLTIWGESAAPMARWATPTRAVVSYGLPFPVPERLEGVDAETLCAWTWTGSGWLSRLQPWSGEAERTQLGGQVSDGPWCGTPASVFAFDVDLLRLSRVDIRLEAARGPGPPQVVTRTVAWRP
jgi:hypothetical protein